MNITELINSLIELRDKHGFIDVIIEKENAMLFIKEIKYDLIAYSLPVYKIMVE